MVTFDKELAETLARFVTVRQGFRRNGREWSKDRGLLLTLAAVCIREADIVYPDEHPDADCLVRAVFKRHEENDVLLQCFRDLVALVDTGKYDKQFSSAVSCEVVRGDDDELAVKLTEMESA